MALPDGSYERLRESMPGHGDGDIAGLNKVTSFVLTVVEHRTASADISRRIFERPGSH